MPISRPISINLQEAISCHQAGEIQKAQQLYKTILAANPQDSDALHLLGVTLFQQGFLETALKLISESVEINPDDFIAFTNLGNVYQGMNRHQDAINCYDNALTIDPRQPNAATHNNRGLALQSLGRENEALASYDAAIHADNEYVEAHFNRGNSLYAFGRYEAALTSLEHVLALRPAYAEAHNNKGNLLHKLHRETEAIASYDDAITLRPGYEQAYFNRGVALQFLDLNLEALASYSNAIKIKPDYAAALNNQGNTYQNLNLYQKALNVYLSAQMIEPAYGDAHWNEALCRLKIGDFENGWIKYEWRWDNSISNPSKVKIYGMLWDGKESLKGKTILLLAEQGLGDTIQFSRYAKMVAQLGATTVIYLHPSLSGLLKDAFEGVAIISETRDEPYDYYCPLLSLPMLFNTSLSTIPASDAYLFGNVSTNTSWKNKLGKKTSLRVGINWSGSKHNSNDHARSIPLPGFLKLLRPDVQWYCLQKEISESDQILLKRHGVAHFEDELTSFSETASLIKQMDIIISVDTAVAHLAAALGKPTWILLAHNADFRWLLGRSDSPWYPSVQLFRQPAIGDWASVISQINRQIIFYMSENIGDFLNFGKHNSDVDHAGI